MELGGGGWSWVEVGAQFSNTHFKSDNWQIVLCLYVVLIITSLCLLQQIKTNY